MILVEAREDDTCERFWSTNLNQSEIYFRMVDIGVSFYTVVDEFMIVQLELFYGFDEGLVFQNLIFLLLIRPTMHQLNRLKTKMHILQT